MCFSAQRWQQFTCHLQQCTTSLWSTASTSRPTIATHVSAKPNWTAWRHVTHIFICAFYFCLPFSTLFCSALFHASSTWTCVDCMHQYCTSVTQCWHSHCSTYLKDFQCAIAPFLMDLKFSFLCSFWRYHPLNFCVYYVPAPPWARPFNSLLFCILSLFLSVSCLNLSLCRYPKDTKPKFNNLKSKKASSFHEFACSTNDAWDINEEEDEDFLGTPAPASSLPSGLHPMSTQNQVSTRHHFFFLSLSSYGHRVGVTWKEIFRCVSTQQQQQNQAVDTETEVSDRLAPPRTESQDLQDVQEEDAEDAECEHVNGKVVKSSSDVHLSPSSGMWVIRCRSSFGIKSYWAAYQVIHSEANYRVCQGGTSHYRWG